MCPFRTKTARRIKPSKRDKINASSLLSQLHCGSLFFCLPQIPPVRSLLVRSLYDFALPIRCCADVACTLCKNQYSVYLFLGERLCFPHRFCPFAIILRFVSSAGRFTFVIWLLFCFLFHRKGRWVSCSLSSLHFALPATQCIVIGPVCLFVCGGVCVCVCYHDNSKLPASIFTKLGL